MKAKTGHLAHSSLNLKQTEKVRRELSKAQSTVEAFKRMKPVLLEWNRAWK